MINDMFSAMYGAREAFERPLSSVAALRFAELDARKQSFNGIVDLRRSLGKER